MINHKSIFNFILIFSAYFWLLAGCKSIDPLPCPEPGEILVDPNSREERVTLTLQNNTCMSICVLLISPDHCEYMGGVNYLEDHPLRSEETISVDLPLGKYATWVELCTGEFRADEHLKINTDTLHVINDPSPGSTPPCGTSLTIINNSDIAICNMRIGNSESVYTGWNWVGSEHIQPGQSLFLTLNPDSYFIRAESCEGAWLRSEVDVSISGDQIWTVP